MTPYELALARRRTYHLFGRLFLEGITADLLPQLNAVPELAELAAQIDLEQAAAGHYHLTAVSVFPYESIFLDPSGLLGGPVSDSILDIYRQNGFDVLSDADHIGHELHFMAHLCAAEAAALAAGDSDAAVLWRSRLQSFLATHLLAWLAPLVVAIEQAATPVYGRLADLTLDLAADHLLQTHAAPPPIPLPDVPRLATEESSLKEISRHLTTPPYCGLFLSRDAISALARRHNLPRGFGDRAQMLTNLLRTAGQYDAAAAVIEDLSTLCANWLDCYQQQQTAFPHLSPWLHPWQDRVAQTAASLREITALLHQTDPQEPSA